MNHMNSMNRSVCTVFSILALCILAMGQFTRPAMAQYSAPAGNAHPAHEHAEGDTAAPFGTTPRQATMDSAKKLAFANALDLRPLKDLAVYNNGRIKILDSLAREVVSSLVGRKDFQDLMPSGDDAAKAKKVGYDPIFTFIDLAIDPAFYADKPLIHVYFLPLREKLLVAAIAGNTPEIEATRERWKRLGRLQPIWIAKHMQAVMNSMPLDGAGGRSANDVQQAMQDYLNAGKMWTIVPVIDSTKPWQHITQLDAAKHPALAAAITSFGNAWRAGDAPAVNAAAVTIATAMPALAPDAYPTFRRNVEQAYNASNPFEWGSWLYAFSLVSLLLALGTQRHWIKWMGIALLAAAVGMHAFGFIARCYIAERFAIQNQFESMTGVSLFAAIVGISLALGRRQLLFAAATAAVGFMILVTATQTGIPGREINREAAILNTSVLLKYHVTIVLFSYGLISLGFITSLFYLAVHYLGAARQRELAAATSGTSNIVGISGGAAVLGGTGGGSGSFGGGNFGSGNLGGSNLGSGIPVDAMTSVAASALGIGFADDARGGTPRLLKDLDKAQITVMQLAFWTLGVGIILGAWWADHSWGRWWAFDPKELWALLTWIVYLIVVHARVGGVANRGLVTAWLSILGFIVMLFCYFGVNLLLPGLHAYA